jgi:hypothetical protein
MWLIVEYQFHRAVEWIRIGTHEDKRVISKVWMRIRGFYPLENCHLSGTVRYQITSNQ